VTNPPSPFLRHALAAAVAILIAYGSLYPFVFRDMGSLGADVSHFLGSWRQPFQSRGDFLANLLLYIPLGLTVTLALEQGMSRHLAVILAAVCGAALSLFIELAQFFDAGRVSAFSDFALNVTGVLVGVAVALVIGGRLAKTAWPAGSGPAFARLLLLAWLGWRLYPYVPTLEIHKYWRSLKPVLFAQDVSVYGIFRYGALWLSVIFLFQTGLRRSMGLVLIAVLAFFAAKASIINQVLSLPELLGAALALLLAPLVVGRFSSIGVPVTAALLLLLVILSRVLPWQFAAAAKPFQWIPFFGFLHGSLTVNVISFAEKFYLYGAVLLLLVRSGIRLSIAVGLECLILFGTGLLQTMMVGRSAEISDAVLALILGCVYAFLRRQHHPEDRLLRPAEAVELRS
jgi:VanZ family protein